MNKPASSTFHYPSSGSISMVAAPAIEKPKECLSEERKEQLDKLARLIWAQLKNGIQVDVNQKGIDITPKSGATVSFPREENAK